MADRFTRGPRQQKRWAGLPGVNFLLNAAGTQGVASIAFTEPGTILRMIGEYTLAFNVAPTALDAAKVTLGLGIISADAFAAGTTALPDPAGNPEWPWMYWAEHQMFAAGSAADPAGEAASVRRFFDSGSMRKVKPSENLVFIVQYSDLTGTPPIRFMQGQVRVLIGT